MIIHTYRLKRKRRKKRRKKNSSIGLIKYKINRFDNYTGYVTLKYHDNSIKKIIIEDNKNAPILEYIVNRNQGDIFDYEGNEILILEKNISLKKEDKRAKYFY